MYREHGGTRSSFTAHCVFSFRVPSSLLPSLSLSLSSWFFHPPFCILFFYILSLLCSFFSSYIFFLPLFASAISFHPSPLQQMDTVHQS